MITATLHARLITSDFDDADGSQPFDEDARLGTIRAYRLWLRRIRALSKRNPKLNWRDVRTKLRPALQRVAHNYWRDYDSDYRKTSANVKAGTRTLMVQLRAVVESLEGQPTFIRRALTSEVTRSGQVQGHEDVYTLALASNQALLAACRVFESRDHRKGGGAIRFQNACRELVPLWEEVFRRRLPRNTKTAKATAAERARGIKQQFENPDVAFLYMTVREIGRRWVKPSQVEEALKALRGGK